MAAKVPHIDAETESTLKQFRELLSSYNKVSEICFNDCVHDMTTRTVLDSENSCVMNCMDKYMKMVQRLSQRFQEHYQMQEMSLLAKQNASTHFN